MANVTFETKELGENLDRLEIAIMGIGVKGARAVGEEILRLSQLEVPHDKGTLQNTGHIETEGSDVLVGYNTEYAARLHEHPEYNFQNGRKGKYLEDPIKNNLGVFAQVFASGAEKDFHL